MRPFIAAILSTCIGCGPSLTWSWVPPEELNAAVAARPETEHPARYLLRDRKILMVSRWNSPSYMQLQEHLVLRIESEAGFEYGDVRIPYPADARFVAFAARSISKEGVVSEIKASRVFDTDALQTEEEDENLRVRVFAFPSLEVGAMIELQYTLELDRIWFGMERWLSEKIPVDKARVQLELTKDLLYSAQTYNYPSKWTVEDLGDRVKLSLEVANIPAREEEDFSPDRRMYEPWWRFRVIQISKYNVVVDIHREWQSTLNGWAEHLYFDSADHYAGFSPSVDLKGCSDSRCRIDRALAFLRENVPFDGFHGDWQGRKARVVLSSGSATHYEKTRLLWWLLKEAGLESKYAYGGRYLETFIDRARPYAPSLEHALLFVPKQKDLEVICGSILPVNIARWEKFPIGWKGPSSRSSAPPNRSAKEDPKWTLRFTLFRASRRCGKSISKTIGCASPATASSTRSSKKPISAAKPSCAGAPFGNGPRTIGATRFRTASRLDIVWPA